MPRFTTDSSDWRPNNIQSSKEKYIPVSPSDPASNSPHCDFGREQGSSVEEPEVEVKNSAADHSTDSPVTEPDPVGLPLQRSGRTVKPPDRLNS